VPNSSQSHKKIVESFKRKFYHEESVITHLPCESLLNNQDGKCNCQIDDIEQFLLDALQEVEREAKEDEQKRIKTEIDVWETMMQSNLFHPMAASKLLKFLKELLKGQYDHEE